MRSRIFLQMMVVLLIWSCEDPTTLPVSQVFNGNKLQTAYSDTFSIKVSTVQLDTFLTNGSGTVLLGNYHDERLGDVNASTYFQVSYLSQFLPNNQLFFDSAILILPYNHKYVGDTTVPMTLNVYQLSNQIQFRKLPQAVENKYSVFSYSILGVGLFNTSVISHYPNPIASTTLKFSPHKDSISIKLPDSFGANWFRLAQFDSAGIFSNSYNFLNYFYGLYIDTDRATNASVAGFTTNGVKLRIYYKGYSGDFLRNSFADFILTNSAYQFNHIDFDRSTGTANNSLKSANILTKVSSNLTDHEGYVQQGTGLVSRLDFPSLRNFFSIINGVTVNAAYLEIYPLRGSYPFNLLPPSGLQLYKTDDSNMPLTTATSGTSSILYDPEFGINTVYRFNIYPYLEFDQVKTNGDVNYIAPLLLGPFLSSGSMGSDIRRLYFGDQFHPENKIRLRIYYTYPLN